MKKSTLPTRLLALGAVFATAAALAVGSAGSAQAAKPGARGDVSSATASISAEAKAAGGDDNITVVVASFKEPGDAPAVRPYDTVRIPPFPEEKP